MLTTRSKAEYLKSRGAVEPLAPRRGMTPTDMTGQRFGYLVVFAFAGRQRSKSGSTHLLWACECDCGRVCTPSRDALIASRGTRSCGCRGVGLRGKMPARTVDEPCYHCGASPSLAGPTERRCELCARAIAALGGLDNFVPWMDSAKFRAHVAALLSPEGS